MYIHIFCFEKVMYKVVFAYIFIIFFFETPGIQKPDLGSRISAKRLRSNCKLLAKELQRVATKLRMTCEGVAELRTTRIGSAAPHNGFIKGFADHGSKVAPHRIYIHNLILHIYIYTYYIYIYMLSRPVKLNRVFPVFYNCIIGHNSL